MGWFKDNRDDRLEDEEDAEEESDENTYEYELVCDNCGEESWINVPKKIRAEDHIKDRICETCGCDVN